MGFITRSWLGKPKKALQISLILINARISFLFYLIIYRKFDFPEGFLKKLIFYNLI